MNFVCYQVLLVLRTYAFWQGDKRVFYGLLAYSVVSVFPLWGSLEQAMSDT